MDMFEKHHRIAVARELCAIAGVPLRDRYGWAASDETVATVVDTVFREPDDQVAADTIGAANILGTIELAMAHDTPTNEETDLTVVRALRSLVLQRTAAEKRKRGEAGP